MCDTVKFSSDRCCRTMGRYQSFQDGADVGNVGTHSEKITQKKIKVR